ncbi:MAG: zinc ribbon domain-containing protein [Clostridia bacterium]|nr:zinc ribbon domain-containing protein [Clostridia bacterium]
MYCSKCGSEIKDSDSICSNCGERIDGHTDVIKEKSKNIGVVILLISLVMQVIILLFGGTLGNALRFALLGTICLTFISSLFCVIMSKSVHKHKGRIIGIIFAILSGITIIVMSCIMLFGFDESPNSINKEGASESASGYEINDNAELQQEIDQGLTTSIKLNSPFNVGNIMTITLTSAEWCDKILPSNPHGVYSYIADTEGEKYFVVHGNLKNYASKEIDIEYSGEAKLLIDNKYHIAANMELEESDGTSFYGNAKPLQTLPVIIYASVSDELYNSCKNIDLTLDLITNDENVGYFYDEEFPHNTYCISFKK